MSDRWLVVAHRAGARIFSIHDHGRALRLVDNLDHPRGRLHAGDIDADRPGRAYDSVGGGRHAMEREEGATERDAADFARLVAARLERGRIESACDELVVVAEPRFLGLLRAALDKPTAALVTASVDKDLAHVVDAGLPAQLGDVLRPAQPR
jgi:protein required for attachment to host cells